MNHSYIMANGEKPLLIKENVIDLHNYNQLTGVRTSKKKLVIENINNVNCHNNHYFSVKFYNIIKSLCLIGKSGHKFNLRLEAFGGGDIYIKNLFIYNTNIDELKFGRKGVITCHIKNLIYFSGALNYVKLDKKCIGKLTTISPHDQYLRHEIFNKELLSVS